MKQQFFAVFAFTALSTTLAPAQGPGNQRTPPTAAEMTANRIAHLTTLLDLTTAQQAQARAIYTSEQSADSSILTGLQAARTALHTAVEANNTAGIATVAAQIGALTVEEVTNQAKADAAFYAVLTPDQKTKFNELQSGGQGGPGGPGGFGGFGPSPFGSGRVR